MARDVRRARADPRFVASHRHPAVRQTVATDLVSKAGLLRGDFDVDRQGNRKRSRQRVVLALGLCPNQPTTAPMAEMGPILRDERGGRRSPESALCGSAEGALP